MFWGEIFEALTRSSMACMILWEDILHLSIQYRNWYVQALSTYIPPISIHMGCENSYKITKEFTIPYNIDTFSLILTRTLFYQTAKVLPSTQAVGTLQLNFCVSKNSHLLLPSSMFRSCKSQHSQQVWNWTQLVAHYSLQSMFLHDQQS